ncbi:AlpA family transcriptional regulator [Marinobacter sp. LV10R520-4]|uniref:helix-turn-helix transcriptional regulator n=1 Tax=Marinobacter sp. LV10R520-4 TaxID=1761796 RepID=UPI000C01B245|nr:AlpA family phage regulatory protein [Marinobacter sp. LV10R520-4]PFG53114.1 AlpA family transcriptional regulator [Marinobacter sp. LV10R520-4]
MKKAPATTARHYTQHDYNTTTAGGYAERIDAIRAALLNAGIEPANMDALLSHMADACRYLGIGRTKLHNLSETDADFPRKIRISPRCVGWTRSQLDAWLDAKQSEVTA